MMDNQKENKVSGSEDNFSLHKLDDYCLLKVFSYLWREDAINLSQTSNRLKNLRMYRFHRLTLDFHSDMLSKTTTRGRVVLDVILSEYGPHIRFWQLSIRERFKHDALELLLRVSKFSTNLKQLILRGVKSMNFLNLNHPEVVECLANVETLSFVCCGFVDSSDFLHHFRNLKQLHFEESGTSSCNLQILFKNNPEIEILNFHGNDSFLGDGSREETFSSGFGLCEFGTKLNRLGLGLSQCTPNDRLQMDKMLRLSTTNLTKLKLDLPSVENIGTFLAEIAKQGTLEELELLRMKIRLDECMVIQSFRFLRLFVFCPKLQSFDKDVPSLLNLFTTWPRSPLRLSLRTNIRMDFSTFAQVVSRIHFNHLQLEEIDGTYENVYVQIFLDSLPPEISPYGKCDLVLHWQHFRVEYESKRVEGPYTFMPEDDKNRSLKIDFGITPDKRKIKSFAY